MQVPAPVTKNLFFEYSAERKYLYISAPDYRDGRIASVEHIRQMISQPWIPDVQSFSLTNVLFERGALQQLRNGKWDSLQRFIFCMGMRDNIYRKGSGDGEVHFADLTAISAKKMKAADFVSIFIDDKECKLLSQSDWPITELNLKNDNINEKACQHLAQTNWKLEKLIIQASHLNDLGLRELSLANWKNLTLLNLSQNNIKDAGCKYVREGGWSELTTLKLNDNMIGPVGCSWLAKAHWPLLRTFYLSFNPIGWKGFKQLSKGKWSELYVLYCQGTYADRMGFIYMMQLDAPKLVKKSQGCYVFTLDDTELITYRRPQYYRYQYIKLA